ncbi:MAG: hypothetical protein KME25_07415 [Symplocastrum torsivum CPER-KK1]|uniref:Uncharacterized protein n=1 Tax=Symplocastrum torsivum CPER-KK1 TaxID=450513 RepID=A0A951PKI3_9CYAN|nr:hypothetical protein [Symplocastrum torsivum CPER-KK1]
METSPPAPLLRGEGSQNLHFLGKAIAYTYTGKRSPMEDQYKAASKRFPSRHHLLAWGFTLFVVDNVNLLVYVSIIHDVNK